MISWLFEIDTLRLSTKDVTWSATEYSGLIIADSFSGITMRWNIAGNGLIAPNEMTFDVSNPGGTSSIGDFEGEFCTVRLIEDDSNTRTWKFKIERAISYYGKITCSCVDFLQEHLVGDYPNTKAPKEIWPSSDSDEDDSDDYCVPIILGEAYIPVRSVNTATERYYILGEDITPLEYTVDEVMSPHAWPNSSTWTPPTYDMDTSVASGYQLLQPKIDESVTPPATGLWPSGDSFYDMLCKYERSDTVGLTNPAEWVEYVLEDFGVAGTDIDSTTFAAAGTAYGELFSGGGWWRKEPRERVLSNLLAQTDSFLKCTDKVELHQFSADPVETITDALLLSFSPSKVTKSKNDSGRVHWPESVTKPSDILTGTTVVPTHGGVGATENTPSSEVLECKFLAGDSVSAQKAGILYFQKKFEQSQRVNFSVTFSTLFTKATLNPGQVVTVDNTLYGGTNNVIITDMTINPDMRVDFTGVILNYLEDWGDLTPAAITVVEDTSEGFPSAEDGEDGTNTATILLYQRDTAPPVVTDIADPVTYTFADRTIAESIGTWSREIPAGTDPLYIISVTVSAKTATITIARSEWSTPVVMAQNGEDGVIGADAITVIMSSPVHSIPFDGDDNIISGAYSGTGTTLTVYEGTTALAYDGVGTADGTWKVTVTGTDITVGTLTDSGTYLTVGDASALTAVVASIKFTIDGKRLDGTALDSMDAVQSFAKVKYGSRSGSIFTFEESTDANITAANVVQWVAASLTDTATAQNVAQSVMAESEDGYIRPNDRITVTDNSASNAATRIYTGAAKSAYASVATTDFSALVVETFDGSVIVNGTLSADKLAANTTLTNNLVVGSHMTLNATGAIFTTGKTAYTSTTAGFWLGYDSAYKLNIGSSTNYLKWTGSALSIAGSISVLNPSSVRGELNVADGADVTSTKTSYDTARVNNVAASTVESRASTGATHAGTAHAPSTADKTTATTIGNAMDGTAVITTGIIRDSGSNMVIDFDDATITINHADGLIVDSAGGIKVTEDSGLKFTTSEGSWDINCTTSGSASFFRIVPSTDLYSWLYIGDSSNKLLTCNIITSGSTYIKPGGTSYRFTDHKISVSSFGGGYADLGDSTDEWTDIYLVNNPTVSSDENKKTAIEVSDLGLDFIKGLQPKKWIWNDGVRPHYGLVAQDVESKMQAGGFDFAGLIKNNHTKVIRVKEELTEEESKSKTPPKEEMIVHTNDVKPDDEIIESFDSYGLRYGEFIGPIIKAIQEIDARLTALEPVEGVIKE